MLEGYFQNINIVNELDRDQQGAFAWIPKHAFTVTSLRRVQDFCSLPHFTFALGTLIAEL